MKRPQERRDDEEQHHRWEPRKSVRGAHPWEERSHETHHGADREVDAATCNHERSADTDQ